MTQRRWWPPAAWLPIGGRASTKTVWSTWSAIGGMPPITFSHLSSLKLSPRFLFKKLAVLKAAKAASPKPGTEIRNGSDSRATAGVAGHANPPHAHVLLC